MWRLRWARAVRWICGLTLAGFGTLAAYASLNDPDTQRLFGAVYMSMNGPYYAVLDDELRDAIERQDDRLIARDSGHNAARQIEAIYDFIAQDVDGLFVNALDTPGVDDAIQSARAAGIPVVAINSPRTDSGQVDCTVASDNAALGALCAGHLLARRSTGRVLALTQQNLVGLEERVRGFSDTLADVPGFSVVQTVFCADAREDARCRTLEAIDAGIAFDVVFAASDNMAVGALAALTERGLQGRVLTYGVNGSSDACLLISEGLMAASATQYPDKIAGQAVESMYALLAGTPVLPVYEIAGRLIDAENVHTVGASGWQSRT